MSLVRVAALQFEPHIGEVERNLEVLGRAVAAAASLGATLAVAPEAAITGYCFDSLDEATAVARKATKLAVDRVSELARRSGVDLVVGTIEAHGRSLFNTAIIASADGRNWAYRKSHLPYLGVDRFVTAGDQAPFVVDLGRVRLGVIICYELRFPEAARICALEGADLIAMPTNWPVGVDFHPDLFMPARAAENHCYVLAADRIGLERGTQFIGRSRVVDFNGVCVAEASGTDSETLITDIDPHASRETRVVLRPGKHEWDTIRDRRPRLYARLVDNNSGVHYNDPPETW